MLQGLDGSIDVIVPRGGKSLVARVQTEARVPVFAHLEGVCHVYVDKAATLDMAKTIVMNAKLRRTGVCGAAEMPGRERQHRRQHGAVAHVQVPVVGPTQRQRPWGGAHGSDRNCASSAVASPSRCTA